MGISDNARDKNTFSATNPCTRFLTTLWLKAVEVIDPSNYTPNSVAFQIVFNLGTPVPLQNGNISYAASPLEWTG